MTNIEKYNQVFIEIFCLDENAIMEDVSKGNMSEWDSVRQLNIIALIEETFDIMLEPEDIIALTSYTIGKDILLKNGISL